MGLDKVAQEGNVDREQKMYKDRAQSIITFSDSGKLKDVER